MTKNIQAAALMLFALFMASCESFYYTEEAEDNSEKNVHINVTEIKQTAFNEDEKDVHFSPSLTRASQPITQLCTRLSFAFFSGDERIKKIDQKVDDEDFGNISLHLEPGTYRLVVLGHKGEGTATISTLDKITFPNNKMTDTFLYSNDITIGEDDVTLDVALKRVVAMFRLKLSEDLSPDVSYLEFYYTGGSSTLSANTGYGSVNSKQTEVRTVAEGQKTFEIYTIPHAETDELTIKITAFDADDLELGSTTLPTVPVTCNRITQYTGSLFHSSAGMNISVSADGEWEGTDEYVPQ